MEETKEEIILKDFKNVILDYGENMCNNKYYIERTKITDDEISIFVYVPRYDDIFFLLYMKKQKTDSNTIPQIKDALPLNEHEPYTLIEDGGEIREYTDEIYILKKVYEKIKKYKSKNIVCYEKYGILVQDLLDFNGIYNINVKCIVKGEH